MQITRILAIRHGETDWNADTRLQGHTDIPLNNRGLWQAGQLARALAGADAINAIYSSDLQRAVVTAQTVADHVQAPLTQLAALRERGFGKFEGKTFCEIETLWPQEAQRWRQRETDWAPEGGETLERVHERVLGVLYELAARHVGQQIAIVAHGGVIDHFYRAATCLSLAAERTWSLGNAAINRLLWSPQGLTLVGWADTAHLDVSVLNEANYKGF
jgi:probable phosphoglycerate mutase